jgi:cytochrome c-type biogenesis protein CcmH/NrfF
MDSGTVANTTTFPWFFAVVIGAVILGAIIAWGMMRNRQRTPIERATTEAATHQNYKAEDRTPGV